MIRRLLQWFRLWFRRRRRLQAQHEAEAWRREAVRRRYLRPRPDEQAVDEDISSWFTRRAGRQWR